MTINKNFFQRVSSLPVVSDATSYVTQSYNGIKDKNVFVGVIFGGVEVSIFKATYTAYHISKIAVPYDYLDQFASERLKKAEEKFPVIKKPSKQIWKEFSTCALSKISGVTSKKKIPKTLNEAVKTRMLCFGKTATNAVANTRAVKMLERIGHKILDNMEEAIEAVVPEKKPHKSKPRTKSDRVLQRISEILSRTKANLNEVAEEIAELKGKHHQHQHRRRRHRHRYLRKEPKERTCAELIEALDQLLSKFYTELRSLSWPDKHFDKTKHLVKLVSTGSLQSMLGSGKAALPALEKLTIYVNERTQSVIKRAEGNGRYLATEVYEESKVLLSDSIETIKKINLIKIPGSTIHALELFWREITNEDFTFSITITESLAFSARAKIRTETLNFSNDSIEQEISTESPTEYFFGSSSPAESLKSCEDCLHCSDQRNSFSDSEKSSKYFDPFQSKSTLASADSSSSTSFWRRLGF